MAEMVSIDKLNIDVIGGQIINRISTKNEEESVCRVKVLIPKCIGSKGEINVEEMVEEYLTVEPDEKKIAHTGDIVMKLSTPYDAAYVDEESNGALVPSFCAIIRNCDKRIENNYLLAFLNSSYCKAELKKQVAGAVMTVLSVGKVKSVTMPILDKQAQTDIGSSFVNACKKLSILSKIAELEYKRNDALFCEVISNE